MTQIGHEHLYFLLLKHLNKCQVNKRIWQVNIQIWQKMWIWQLTYIFGKIEYSKLNFNCSNKGRKRLSMNYSFILFTILFFIFPIFSMTYYILVLTYSPVLSFSRYVGCTHLRNIPLCKKKNPNTYSSLKIKFLTYIA